MKYSKIVVSIGLAIALLGCTDPDRAKSVLSKSGYTEVVVTGYSPFSCGEDDSFSTGFRAKNPAGQIVEGTVCSGLIKDGTIRF